MDDLISRAAAIDALHMDTSIIPFEKAREYADATISEIRNRLEKLPSAQPEQQWIPWDGGRFPDDSGTYIVTAYDGVKERVTFVKYQKRLKQWELTGARAYWRVLAWMPLPEPYAEGRTDEADNRKE